MAVKCNIIPSIKKKLDQLHWGISNDFDEDSILENYIEQLDCDTVIIVPCNSGDCVDNTINFTCTLSITKISVIILENIVTFFIDTGDIVNGTAPFTYNWDFEEDDFDNSGAINVSTATLTVKPTKNIDFLVSKIILTLTDSNGCIATKTCYLVIGEMECSNSYVVCPPVTRLIVSNKQVQCPKLTGLIVFKKL